MATAVFLKHFYYEDLVIRYREFSESQNKPVLAFALYAVCEILLVNRIIGHVLLDSPFGLLFIVQVALKKIHIVIYVREILYVKDKKV